MQRDNPQIDVPLYSCSPKRHLDPNFVRESIAAVLMEQEYEGDAWLAAGRIETKCRKSCER